MAHYYGVQFLAARAALGVELAEVRRAVQMGMTTLKKIERSDVVQVVERARGRNAGGLVERAGFERLVAYYETQGIEFLPARGAKGPGIRINVPVEQHKQRAARQRKRASK